MYMYVDINRYMYIHARFCAYTKPMPVVSCFFEVYKAPMDSQLVRAWRRDLMVPEGGAAV